MTMPDEFTEGIRSCTDDHGFHFSRWAEDGLPKVTPLWLLKYLPNMPASHIAIYNDLRGPNNSITLREASPNLAIAEAYCTILRGSADLLLAGATGTRIHPLRTVHVALQEELAENGNDPAHACRPFDLHRRGLVLGEGAGALVLEELGSAQARGASILGEIVGYGSSTYLRRDGVAECGLAVENSVRQALRTSGLSPAQLGHVHAHGGGTRKGDAEEAQALRRVLGTHADSIPVVAAKSYFGNLGAGSGIIETITSLLALNQQRIFPVLNFETPDPECPIRVARAGDPVGDSFLNVNFSPQAQASAIVIRRFS
jgi:3-oxoacyl-[acyl-carrier-protein] synthase II